MPNALQGANSKTNLLSSNVVISNQFAMLAGLAPTSKQGTFSPSEQWESFVRPFRRVLANGFLLLVGASLPRIENRLKVTNSECNKLVFELPPSMAFDTIYVVSRRRQLRPQMQEKGWTIKPKGRTWRYPRTHFPHRQWSISQRSGFVCQRLRKRRLSCNE